MERGVSRGKREVCPSDQATRKGLGNLDSLACLGELRQQHCCRNSPNTKN